MEFIIMLALGGKNINNNSMMNKSLPLISCLCVTRKKPKLLERAISCFTYQVYPQKELIIVYEDDDDYTINFINDLKLSQRNDIKLVLVKSIPKTSLGKLRNIGINVASGTYICQWDDDDWYHCCRLTYKYKALKENGKTGSVLTQWLVFNTIENKAYLSNRRVWEGSILCEKDILQSKPYDDKSMGEDTPTIDYLVSTNSLYLIRDNPVIYIYVYHGNNTWDYNHWNYIFECSTELSKEDSLIIKDILAQKYTIQEGSLILDKILENNQELKKGINT